MLLLATVLYNVKFVTTAAMGAVYKYNPEVRARRRAGPGVGVVTHTPDERVVVMHGAENGMGGLYGFFT